MLRPIALLLSGLGLVATGFAGSVETSCYAAVGPTLQASGGALTPEVRATYLDWAEKGVLKELAGAKIPAAILAEVHGDPTLRDAVFGSVFPPDPSILQNYAAFRADLGDKFSAKYRSLVLAMAVAKRTKGVETLGTEIGRDYQPGFWTDESLQVPGSPGEKDLVRRIADFMDGAKMSALDLYQDGTKQGQLKAYLAAKGIPANLIGEVRKSVGFGERLKNAMVMLGQRPAARARKPVTTDWVRYLASINEAKPSSTPMQDGRPMPWPLFPLASAPWPLLMPLAHPVPLGEADYIWGAFQGEYGPDRYHTYGPYRGDDDVVPDSLRPSKWFWDAWPDRIVHGGMCVPISKGTVDLYSALGKPAMWAGQPGHANLVSFQWVNDAWTAEVEQAFAGGPDVTFAQWYFDDAPDFGIRFRDLYDWVGAEHHLGLALGMNLGVRSYMDTRLAVNLYRAIPEPSRPTLGAKLLKGALRVNPYNAEVWYRLAWDATDPLQGAAICEAALKANPGLLFDKPADLRGPSEASRQYWQTLARFTVQYSLLSHPLPQKEVDRLRVHKLLRTVPGLLPSEVAAVFEAGEPDDAPEAVRFDKDLANGGDPYGQLRMGQRCLYGDGMKLDEGMARSFLAGAAGQGDPTAALLLNRLSPTFGGDVVTATASNTFSEDQSPKHLTDGSGMVGLIHDNDYAAKTMWHTGEHPPLTAPAKGLPPSPAWVRFDFATPTKFDSLLIWNHNQLNLTDRGLRKVRIYGSADGAKWTPLAVGTVEIPRASGNPVSLPFTVPNGASGGALKSVLIVAEPTEGNYGSSVYGLSAVRFAVRPLVGVVPERLVSVRASSVYADTQASRHLIDGSGMCGTFHDNADGAETMWHTAENPPASAPAPGLPAAPAWLRFDFAKPQALGALLIWNHNQPGLTDRGFHKVRLYGTVDGATWTPLTASSVEIPRANGGPMAVPCEVSVATGAKLLQSVLIVAENTEGNYGGNCYGLSAVRFVAHR